MAGRRTLSCFSGSVVQDNRLTGVAGDRLATARDEQCCREIITSPIGSREIGGVSQSFGNLPCVAFASNRNRIIDIPFGSRHDASMRKPAVSPAVRKMHVSTAETSDPHAVPAKFPRVSAAGRCAKTIVAADIHGVSAELRSMIESVVGGAVFLSPWDTDACPFTNEQEAVSAFISQNGIESYAEKISVAACREPVYIVGFSVGASAAWLYSTSSSCNPDSAATLFYGSRIRDHAALVPRFNISAIFAETEPSFSPDQVARTITRDNVRTFVEPGTFHGFMNPRSANFAPAQCAAHLQRLAVELKQFQYHLAHR